jgi:signal transduction protein with GAF and PtsI domain
LWLTAFTKEYRCPPHFIGIGTNDLTQFTLALGRDIHAKEKNPRIKTYLKGLYNESDFSIIKQIYDVSKQCTQFGTRLFLLGQAAANPAYALLMGSLGITPSVGADSVAHVKGVVYEFEKKDPEEALKAYIETTCSQYPPEVRSYVKSALSQMLME